MIFLVESFFVFLRFVWRGISGINKAANRSCCVTFNRIVIAHNGGTRKALLISSWVKTFILIKVEVNSIIFNPVLFDRGRSFNVFFWKEFSFNDAHQQHHCFNMYIRNFSFKYFDVHWPFRHSDSTISNLMSLFFVFPFHSNQSKKMTALLRRGLINTIIDVI